MNVPSISILKKRLQDIRLVIDGQRHMRESMPHELANVATQVIRTLKPFGRPLEPLAQRNLGPKPLSIAKFLVIAAKSSHFTVGWAQPHRLHLELGIAGHNLRD